MCSFGLAWTIALFVSTASAGEYSARTHYYSIEFLKPTQGTGDVCVLNITLNREFDSQTAERLLREELARAVNLFPPKGEIMAYAWRQTDPKPGSEQMVPLSDGSRFLIYSLKTKTVLTEKEYDASQQKPAQPGREIRVEFSLDFDRAADGRVRVVGKTNLPRGMKLMLDLRRAQSKYFAQGDIEVANGSIGSAWFSDHGDPLAPGNYEIGISSSLPALQPKSIRQIIGESGENLSGAVRNSMGAKMVEYKTLKSLQ